MDTDTALDDALALHKAGRIGEAEARYRAILEAEPTHASALHLLGVIALRKGRAEEAAALIERAIAQRPDSAAYHNNLGNARRALGRDEDAMASYRRAVELDRTLLDAHVNLGSMLRLAGRLEEARSVLERARAIGPRNAALLNNLANVVDAQGETGRAMDLYRLALQSDPANGEAALNLGRSHLRAGDFDAGRPLLETAVAALPDNAEAHALLGNTLLAAKRVDDAERAYRRALAIQADNVPALVHLGIVHLERGAYADAESHMRGALAIDAAAVGAHNGLGVCFMALGRYLDAVREFEEELRRDPVDADAHMNLGLARLLLGELEAGWPEYEHRLLRKSMNTATGPRWTGAPLDTSTLLVFPEQGAGDNIQFVRYLARVRDENPKARIVYPAPAELRRLFAPALSAWRVDMPEPHGDIEITGFQIALLSLPGLFRTSPASIPAQIPYLRADQAEVAAWRARLQGHAGLKVGLVWAGNPEYRMDRDRSLPADEVVRLLQAGGACFVSLQKGAPDAPARSDRLLDWMGEVRDFADTAALIEALDLVISVDTSVAHLAGALGRPVWLANRFSPDWRWMLGREDSPWYPTMRIFRQPARGDWTSVVGALRRALAEEVRREK